MTLKVRTIKVSDETWEKWQKRAASKGISVAALIHDTMDPKPVVYTDASVFNAKTKLPTYWERQQKKGKSA